MIIALFSLIAGLGIVWASRGFFAGNFQIELPTAPAEFAEYLPLFIAVTVIFGVFAGLYPALVLSRFNPIQALRGNLKSSHSGQWLSKSLTIFQFIVSTALITTSIIVISQMQHVRNQDLGFNSENVLKIPVQRDLLTSNYQALKNSILDVPGVLAMSTGSHGMDGSTSSGPAIVMGRSSEEAVQLGYYASGYDFAQVIDLQMQAGRFFSREFTGDAEFGLILNETAVAEMQLEDPLGTVVQFNNRERTVVGVVKDFNYASLHSKIGPFALVMPFVGPDLLLIRIDQNANPTLLTDINRVWTEVLGAAPFEPDYLDEGIQQMYVRETTLSSMIRLFAILAVFLGCLGLYGLVTFSVQNKLREIGIRKALGASVQSILLLLTRQFVILVVIASIIALPITWYFAEQWLSNFSYRIDIQWWMFTVASFALLSMALLTISGQTLKAALTNPVSILKTE